MKKPVMPMILLLSICLTHCSTHEPNLKDVEGPPRMSETVKQAQTVQWCDLVHNPERYEQQVVRTRALYYRDHENTSLYERECDNERSTPVWAVNDPSYVYSDERIRQRFVELIRPTGTSSSGTAMVTVVGKFETGGGPYGHLGGYHSQFSIIRLEEAE